MLSVRARCTARPPNGALRSNRPRSRLRLLAVADDVFLDHPPGLLVGVLNGRRLLEVCRGCDLRPGESIVECQFGAANSVDYNTGGVRRVPHFQLHLDVERDVSEGPSLEPDVRPL